MSAVNGYRAVFDGAEYEASPDGELVRVYSSSPAPGFEKIAADRYRRLVPASAVEWLGYVRTTAVVGGRTVVVVDAHDGRVLVDYYDLAGWRPECGPEPGLWRAWVAETELASPAQQRLAAR